MTEYIEREAALNAINENKSSTELAWITVSKIPAADVAPVVHGKWDDSFDGITPVCSVCGRTHKCFNRTPNYCPNCGAKMDE